MLLSICIPSYNRFGQMRMNLESIFKARSKEFEVVIVDNCSTNNIDGLGISDDRLNVIKRKEKVDGRINVWESLLFGKGKYVMMCLDKDYIDGDSLDIFISKLQRNENIQGGYCVLDKKNSKGTASLVTNNFEKVIYKNRHPSGTFYRKEILKEEYETVKFKDRKSIYYLNAFIEDFLLAKCMVKGNIYIYDSPLVFTANTIRVVDENSMAKSYTYKPENKNLFFMPNCRLKQLNINLLHLDTLNFTSEEKNKIIREITGEALLTCTVGYEEVMKNSDICMHYYIESRQVTRKELKRYVGDWDEFIRENRFINSNKIFMFRLILHARFKLLYCMLKKMVKNSVKKIYRKGKN